MLVYRFLVGRKWLIRILAGIVLVVAFVRLGMWQLDRADERTAQNTLLETNFAADPVPADELLSIDASIDPADEWRSVTARGRYVADDQLLLRLRPVDGQNGVHVITPLVTTEGTVLLIDRGFVITSGADLPEVAGPATGEVEVTARVRKTETGRGTGGDPTEGAIRYLDVDALTDFLDTDTYGDWATLTSEDPSSPEAPTPIPPPEIESGPHLSYALQWFAFAIVGVVGFVLLVRMEGRADVSENRPEENAETG